MPYGFRKFTSFSWARGRFINSNSEEWEQLGNVTVRHLHLECSSTQAWQCATFLNPCNILGIPNVDNTIIHYDGSINPPEPEPPTPVNYKKSKFKWVLYSEKIRKRRK